MKKLSDSDPAFTTTLSGIVCHPPLNDSELQWFNDYFATPHILRSHTISDLYYCQNKQESLREIISLQSEQELLDDFKFSGWVFQQKKLNVNPMSVFLLASDIHQVAQGLVQILHHFFLPNALVHRFAPELKLQKREMKGTLYIKMNQPGHLFSLEIIDDFVVLNEYALEYQVFSKGKKQLYLISASMQECFTYQKEIAKQYSDIDIKILKELTPHICYKFTYQASEMIQTALMYDKFSNMLDGIKQASPIRKI